MKMFYRMLKNAAIKYSLKKEFKLKTNPFQLNKYPYNSAKTLMKFNN